MPQSEIVVNFVLKTPIENILKRVHTTAVKQLNTKMRRIKKIILEELPKRLRKAIKASPVYFLLVYDLAGDVALYGQLGITDIGARLDNIIDHWCSPENIVVEEQPFNITNNNISGFLRIKMIKGDYSDVLDLAIAKALVDSKKGTTTEIPWLEWLLLSGPGYIIRDYVYFESDRTAVSSRTHTGIMRSKPGDGWRIPPEYAGTQEDNFLTRILDQELAQITQEIFAKIEKYA